MFDFRKMGAGLEALKSFSAQSKQLAGKMEAMKARMEGATVEGIAGAGMVRVRMNAAKQCLAVDIDPAIAGKTTVIADLTKAAINEALQKVAEKETEIQMEMAQSMLSELPGLVSDLKGKGKPDLR